MTAQPEPQIPQVSGGPEPDDSDEPERPRHLVLKRTIGHPILGTVRIHVPDRDGQGHEITVKVAAVRDHGRQVLILVTAPPDVLILRAELEHASRNQDAEPRSLSGPQS